MGEHLVVLLEDLVEGHVVDVDKLLQLQARGRSPEEGKGGGGRVDVARARALVEKEVRADDKRQRWAMIYPTLPHPTLRCPEGDRLRICP